MQNEGFGSKLQNSTTITFRCFKSTWLQLILIGIAVIAGATPAGAIQFWQGAPGVPQNWYDPGMWTSPPGDNATSWVINNGGTAVINSNTPPYNSYGSVLVSDTYQGNLIQNGGTFSVGDLTVGGSGGGSGSFQLTNGRVYAPGAVQVGFLAPSSITQTGGVLTGANHGTTLNVLSWGTYSLSGSSSSITADYLQLQNRGGNGGLFTQDAGTVSAYTQLVIGYVSLPGNHCEYDLNGGSLTAGNTFLGTSGGDDLMRQTGGTNTSSILYIAATGKYRFGGGQLTVTGQLTQKGRFEVNGTGTSIQIGTYTQSDDSSTLCSEVHAEGITTMHVTGSATINGTWTILDGGAPIGRWNVLQTDGLISGSFDSVYLPNAEWSWGVDASKTLWVQHVPEPTTLSLMALCGLCVLRRRN